MAPTSAQARAGVHESWARTVDRTARTAPGTAAFLARFEREVDPDGTLEPTERAIRAEHARKAYFTRLAIRSAASRRAKRHLAESAARPARGDSPAPAVVAERGDLSGEAA